MCEDLKKQQTNPSHYNHTQENVSSTTQLIVITGKMIMLTFPINY